MNPSWLALLSYLFISPAWAEPAPEISLKHEFHTKRDWYARATIPPGKDAQIGDDAASLCFRPSFESKSEQCEKAEVGPPRFAIRYPFQTVKSLSILQKPHLIQFITEFSGGGSGTLTRIAFWRYDLLNDIFKPGGDIILTEQGEYQIDGKSRLITADAYMQTDETHFSPHHFNITIYRYHPQSGFTKALSYLTKAKYPSFDNRDKIDVISHETTTIQQRLEGL